MSDDTEVSEQEIKDAIRFINGDKDEEAEDAYFALEPVVLSSVNVGLPLLERLANDVNEFALGYLGAGLLEDFLASRGMDDPELIESAMKRNQRLAIALGGVRSLALPFELVKRLSPIAKQREKALPNST